MKRITKLNKLSLEVIQQKRGTLRRYLTLLCGIFQIPGDVAIIRLTEQETGSVLARTGTFLQKPGGLIYPVKGVRLRDSGFILCGSHTQSFPADFRLLLDQTLALAHTNQIVIKSEMTGLFNQRGLFLQVGQLIEDARRLNLPVCALFIDGDHLKQINDTLGHDAGDRVIRMIGTVIKEASRRNDLAIHRSGDEFCLILSNASPEQGCLVGERILKKLAQININGSPLTASIGVSRTGYDIDHLLKEADQAMYEAKHQGRARVCLFSE